MNVIKVCVVCQNLCASCTLLPTQELRMSQISVCSSKLAMISGFLPFLILRKALHQTPYVSYQHVCCHLSAFLFQESFKRTKQLFILAHFFSNSSNFLSTHRPFLEGLIPALKYFFRI